MNRGEDPGGRALPPGGERGVQEAQLRPGGGALPKGPAAVRLHLPRGRRGGAVAGLREGHSAMSQLDSGGACIWARARQAGGT